MTFRVPAALIRHICYPAGYRLPKLERLDFKWEPPKKVGTTGVQVQAHLELPKNGEKGNLFNEEYRFFVGKPYPQNPSSTCRWCGVFFQTEYSRKNHTGPCKSSLVDLYRDLLRTNKCIVCSAHTVRHTWGIPLCGEPCVTCWKFNAPKAFQEAVLERKKKLLL